MKVLFFALTTALLYANVSCVRLSAGKEQAAMSPSVPVAVPKLVANLGMDYREVKKRSTIDLGRGIYADEDEYARRNRIFIKDQGSFDWEVMGTSLHFPGCRYFWLQTGDKDDPKLAELHITTARDTMGWTKLQTELWEIQKRLGAAGFKPVRFADGETSDDLLREMIREFPKKDDRDLGGVMYVRGDVVLSLSAQRLSTPKTGEDPTATDDFIHQVSLHSRSYWADSFKAIGGTLPPP